MWLLPKSMPLLEPGAFHVWRAFCTPATIDLAWHEALLTPEEMARSARLATPILRRRFLLAHSLLHTLLRAYTQISMQERCELATHATGKPFLRAPQLQPA